MASVLHCLVLSEQRSVSPTSLALSEDFSVFNCYLLEKSDNDPALWSEIRDAETAKVGNCRTPSKRHTMFMLTCVWERFSPSLLSVVERTNWWQYLHRCKCHDCYIAKEKRDLLKVTAQFPGHPQGNETWFVWVIHDTVTIAGYSVLLLAQPRGIIFIYIFALFTLIET